MDIKHGGMLMRVRHIRISTIPQAKPELRLHGLRARLRREVAAAVRELPAARLYGAEHTTASAVRAQEPTGQQFLHVLEVRFAARPTAQLAESRRFERLRLQRGRTTRVARRYERWYLK